MAFKRTRDLRLDSPLLYRTKTVNATEQLDCGQACLEVDCDSFNYFVSNGTCEINWHPLQHLHLKFLVPSVGWDWWLASTNFETL